MIHVNRNQDFLGQFTEEEVREGLRSGKFFNTDLAWRAGMTEWQPLSAWGWGIEDVAGVGGEPLTGSSPVWEKAPQVGWFTAWWNSTLEILFSPIKTFSTLKTTGGYRLPLIYAAVSGTLGLAMVLLAEVLAGAIARGWAAGAVPASLATELGGLLCALVITPLFCVLGVFINGGVLHGCLKLVGGANNSFETTARVVAYAGGAVNALNIVPLLGSLAASLWGPVLYTIALKEAHKTTYGRVILALLIPLMICCGALLLVGFFAWGSLIGYLRATGGH